MITLGKLQTPEDLENVIVKTDPKGAVVRLKDVGRVERKTEATGGYASCNGKPSVALGVYPLSGMRPKELSRCFRRG